METGKKYKLADECITPGGRNMDKMEQRIEQIEKFASQCYEDGERYSAFISGAVWADNNPPQDIVNLNKVWHDPSEEPQGDEWHIAYIDFFGSIQSLKCPSVTFDTFPSLADFAAGVGMQCWAYITDLLPKGGEK